MAAFFSILLGLALVAGIVYMLRRYQERATEETAERHAPLPPLDPSTRTQAVLDTAALDEQSEANTTVQAQSPVENDPAPGPEAEPEPELEPEPEPEIKPEPERAPVPGAKPEPTPAPASVTDTAPANWQERCQQLKLEGRLDEALALAKQVYPQWSAFEQQTVVLRMQIRDQKRKGGSIDELASQLYVAAARASCLHDKLKDMPPPPVARKLAELIPQSELQALEMPYEHIGFDALRLLTKTDRRMLESLWGPPKNHVSARQYHQQYWQQKQASLSNTH